VERTPIRKEAVDMTGYQRVFAWVIVSLIVGMLVVTLVSEGAS
jgi:hypothetical protein